MLILSLFARDFKPRVQPVENFHDSQHTVVVRLSDDPFVNLHFTSHEQLFELIDTLYAADKARNDAIRIATIEARDAVKAAT